MQGTVVSIVVGLVALLLIAASLLGWPFAIAVTGFVIVLGSLALEIVRAERDGLGTAQERERVAREAANEAKTKAGH